MWMQDIRYMCVDAGHQVHVCGCRTSGTCMWMQDIRYMYVDAGHYSVASEAVGQKSRYVEGLTIRADMLVPYIYEDTYNIV